jgi:hypothetical protein
MVVLAPGGPPMSRRVYLSHLDMPKGDFRYWHKMRRCRPRRAMSEFRVQSGIHLLGTSISHFDPYATFKRSVDREPFGKAAFVPRHDDAALNLTLL